MKKFPGPGGPYCHSACTHTVHTLLQTNIDNRTDPVHLLTNREKQNIDSKSTSIYVFLPYPNPITSLSQSLIS